MDDAGLPSRSIRVGAAVGWTILILLLCFMPLDWLGPDVAEEGFFRVPVPSPDKLVHVTLFAGFAALWTVAAWPRRALAAVVVAGLLLAAGTELVQAAPVVARDGNLPDLLADALGVVVGAAVTPPLLRRRASL
jgi:hypothetical protein